MRGARSRARAGVRRHRAAQNDAAAQADRRATAEARGGLRERDEKLSALLADKTALDAELTRLRAEVAEARKIATAQLRYTHDYSEAETRDAFIDLLLKEAGWQLDQPRDREFESTACPTTRARLRRLCVVGR